MAQNIELAPYIKDLVIAYQNMPLTARREKVLQHLKQAYLLASSESLQPFTLSK